MNYKCKVKISEVTNLSDARYAAAMGFNYIGFCFDNEKSNYIAPIKAKEMIDWLSGSNIVAEFGNQSIDEIKDISELLQVNAIEVENRILPDELKQLSKAAIKKIDVCSFSDEELLKELEAYQSVCDAFHLYNSKSYNENENFLKELCIKNNIIWNINCSPDTIKIIIEKHNPFAVNIVGEDEEEVGLKDFEVLNNLLEEITNSN